MLEFASCNLLLFVIGKSRVKRILSNWELSITSKIFLTIIRLFKFCMLMLFSACDCSPGTYLRLVTFQLKMHLCGCLWMLMAIIDVCDVNPSKTSKVQNSMMFIPRQQLLRINRTAFAMPVDVTQTTGSQPMIFACMSRLRRIQNSSLAIWFLSTLLL